MFNKVGGAIAKKGMKPLTLPILLLILVILFAIRVFVVQYSYGYLKDKFDKNNQFPNMTFFDTMILIIGVGMLLNL